MPEELENQTQTSDPVPEEEQYLNYIINFNNCTFNAPITIKQTGKPKDPPNPPGSLETETNGLPG